MVLESLVSAIKAERKPWDMFFIGLLYSSAAMFISLWIFREQASLVMVFLTVVACLPLIHSTFKREEEKDMRIANEGILLKEHGKALSYFMFLFLGFVISFVIWYVVLPQDLVSTTFSTQSSAIEAINTRVTTGAISDIGLFGQILANNLRVLFFCVMFALFYGAGTIFILAWNASVISAAIGNFIRTNLANYVTQVGLFNLGGYLHIFSLGLLRYLTHGIPEIFAYFVGGLAGGIISIAIIRHSVGTENFKHVLFDSIDLIILAIVTLVVAALIETFITPALF